MWRNQGYGTTAIMVVRAEIKTCPTAFFTTIPNVTCTVVLHYRRHGISLFYGNPKFYVSCGICATGVRCRGYGCQVSWNLESVDTSVWYHGIWNLCGTCCFSRQCWMGFSPLSPGISGPHFPPSSKWSWVDYFLLVIQ